MPGGLLDMFGIDPIANRNNRRADETRERMIAAEIQKQELANKGQMDVEGKRGEETRKTAKDKGEQDKLMEVLKSNNAISEAAKAQIMAIMAKEGVIYSPENEKVFDKSLSDTRMRKALQSDTQTINARQAPGFAETLAQGMQAQNLAPAFANQRAGTLSAQPGELVAQPPSGTSLPPTDLNQWNQMQGATENQTVDETPSPYPGMPGQLKVIKQQQPGRIRISPQILQQAMQMQQQPKPNTPTQYSVDELLRGAGVIPMPQLY